MRVLLTAMAVFISSHCPAMPALDREISRLENQWASVRYQTADADKARGFDALLKRSRSLGKQFPGQAEPLIWEAILLCTSAGESGGLGALDKIETARSLLLKAIDLDPDALEGSAQVTLGSLYYLVPGWPISFGDDDLARRYLEESLRINPDGIDPNYFYGDFLMSQGEREKARQYFRKALAAPERPDQPLADSKLKQEARIALKKAELTQDSQFSQVLRSFFNAGTAGGNSDTASD